MFRMLCGEEVLKNVIIVTNRWGGVNLRVAEAREAELAGRDIFYRPVLARGARMTRHQNTVLSAERIIRLILQNRPSVFCFQKDQVETSTQKDQAVTFTQKDQMVMFIHL